MKIRGNGATRAENIEETEKHEQNMEEMLKQEQDKEEHMKQEQKLSEGGWRHG